jgi:hypothetical protein
MKRIQAIFDSAVLAFTDGGSARHVARMRWRLNVTT